MKVSKADASVSPGFGGPQDFVDELVLLLCKLTYWLIANYLFILANN